MKRYVLILLLLPLLPMLSQAQSNRDFRFGLHMSPLVGWMKPDAKDYISDGSIVNINYGFSTEFLLAQSYTFATGIDVMTMGGKLVYPHALKINAADSVASPGTMTRKYRTQYLQIPLTIRMRTNEMGYLTFFGQFGFTAGFNLKSRAFDEFNLEGNNPVDKFTSENVDIKDEISFFRAGMLIGLGVEYSLGTTTALSGGITFNNGFTDVLKGKNAIDSSREENAISNAIELSLGVTF